MGTRRVRRKDGEFTLFYRKVSPFSNHHPAEFDCGESINFEETKHFSCSEQYYMYNKASLLEDRQLMKSVLEADNPRAMKSMCSKGALNGWSDSVWNEHKENVMYIGSCAKYRASQHLRYALFLTTGSKLVECAPFDNVWGIGIDLKEAVSNESVSIRSGMNLLGKILDRVREELWEDKEYQDERKEVERRLNQDKYYLMNAMKHIDLIYKDRATRRYLMSKGHMSSDDQSYLTTSVRSLFPEWALPPPIEKDEPIRPSPPQIINFPRTPPIRSTRSITPPPKESRLFGRLSVGDTRRRESRSSSRFTWERSMSRSRSRSRSRRRQNRKRSRSRSKSYERDRKRRRRDSRSKSRSKSPKDRKRSEEKEERKHRKKKKSHKKRDRSRSRSRSRRSESKEERRRIRKERKRAKKEKKERRRKRRTSSTSSS
ncbi:hypothetical protein CRE_18939 [Caenorhabditis remanei]|uniref:NADAR domain-containing protein n=1 Tax=Caenorhabditis remanei TaxID=31234 RepID=E3LK85_CAERE|nr:hypothetical protein CRE_18939 [Caenorhabditis remanei]